MSSRVEMRGGTRVEFPEPGTCDCREHRFGPETEDGFYTVTQVQRGGWVRVFARHVDFVGEMSPFFDTEPWDAPRVRRLALRHARSSLAAERPDHWAVRA